MELFITTVNQMALLFTFIALGYLLGKTKYISAGTEKMLSRLEMALFMPALNLNTFIKNCTPENLSEWKWIILFGAAVGLASMPIATLLSKLVTNDNYLQKIYTYGLCISNFGFMGNAVVAAIFPDMLFQYMLFTMPFTVMIYTWAVPFLLLNDSDGTKKRSPRDIAKSLFNPPFVCLFIGAAIGLIGIRLPEFITSTMSAAAGCYSPVAMILTGLTIAAKDFRKMLEHKSIYPVILLRLIIIPVIAAIAFSFISIPKTFYVCLVVFLSLPLGLNTIVIPEAYGKDTSAAAGMTVVSHILATVTVPLIFSIFL